MKKALSLVLALVLVFGMSTVAFAAPKIDSVVDGADFLLDDTGAPYGGFSADDIYSEKVFQDKVVIWINPAAFKAKDGTVMTNVTTSMLSSASVKVRLDAKSKEKAIIKSVELKHRKDLPTTHPAYGGIENHAYIEVQFVEDFVSVSDVEFDFDVQLTYKGVVKGTANFNGTFKVNKETVEDGQEEADTSDGITLEPDVLVRNIEIHGGENFYAKVNLASNKKYYLTAETAIKDEDVQVVDKYPEISMIYYIDQVNMKFGGNNYYFKDLGEEYFVYNAEGRLIGTSNDELPFSEKYYLATKKIEMGGGDPEPSESAPAESTEPAPEPAPDLGGDDGADEPTGYNPNTGL